MTKLANAFHLFDKANSADPNIEKYGEQSAPKELLYAQRMTAMLSTFCPNASEHLQLAARAQHIERWKSPRSNYPEGRAGYKKWRAELNLFHAERAGELMAEAGYTKADIDRTQYLIQKRQLTRDPETQTLEDVICLVFLQYYLDDFAQKHTEDKLITIIQKTWGKMSETGHQSALALQHSDAMLNLINKALN